MRKTISIRRSSESSGSAKGRWVWLWNKNRGGTARRRVSSICLVPSYIHHIRIKSLSRRRRIIIKIWYIRKRNLWRRIREGDKKILVLKNHNITRYMNMLQLWVITKKTFLLRFITKKGTCHRLG